MQQYLRLPIDMEPLFAGNNLATCALKESIARHLHLLLTTAVGENKQEAKYGASYWDYDYHTHMSNDLRRELIMSDVLRMVQQYEKRLLNPTVEVNVKQVECADNKHMRIRKRIELVVTGNLARTNEFFSFQTGFFIGPLLLD